MLQWLGRQLGLASIVATTCTSLPFIFRSLNFIFCHLIFIPPPPVGPLTRPSLQYPCHQGNLALTVPRVMKTPIQMSPYWELSSALWRLIIAEFCGFRSETFITRWREGNILPRDNSSTEEDVIKRGQMCSLHKGLDGVLTLETLTRADSETNWRLQITTSISAYIFILPARKAETGIAHISAWGRSV